MKEHLLEQGTRRTPQSEPIPGSAQVENSAGGYSYEVDCWTSLRRFLILGTEGGSYYAAERKLTTDNVAALAACIKADGARAVAMIVDVSERGLAPSNDQALFALAACTSPDYADPPTRRLAAEALPRVARIGTHLFHFAAYAQTMRGWGPTMRWAIANWYEAKAAAGDGEDASQLAYDAVKYRQRDGWSHRDLLRKSHPVPANDQQDALYSWIVGKTTDIGALPAIVDAFEAAQHSTSAAQTAGLVRECNVVLPREALVSDHLADPDVWRALLERGMPLGAMVRNLANMTRIGVLDSAEYRNLVRGEIGDQEKISRSRIHPMALLLGLRTYAAGFSLRGSNTWRPNPTIIDALDEAFYLAFDNVVPSGKSTMLALDVSGSMASGMVAGAPLSPREASAAMALVTLHAEDDVEVVGFSHHLVPLALSRRQRLDDAIRAVSGLPFHATDCALPMLDALKRRSGAEAFVVYTDSETWFGNVHPKQALDQYRRETGIHARSVVVGMVSNPFSIADPADPGMLDVVGFDASAPALISEFAAGRL